MTNKKIYSFINKKSDLITKILLNNYDSADFELHVSQIEKEIFQISLSYANIFFFENNYLNNKDRKEFIYYVVSRFNIKKKTALKMNDENLLAHYIKAEVLTRLRDKDFLLF